MHAYPLYSPAARSFLDPELVPFSCALTAGLSGTVVNVSVTVAVVAIATLFFIMLVYTAVPGTESYDKLMNERAEYIVFNGHVGALTEHYPLQAKVGETIRIFFGVGGPNFTSAFHVIGTVFDRTVVEGQVGHDAQTINLAPSQGGWVEFTLDEEGTFALDDFLKGLETGQPTQPDFRAALRTQKVCDAVLASARSGQWVEI